MPERDSRVPASLSAWWDPSGSERDPVSVAPRVLLPGGVSVSRPRVIGDAVGCVLLGVDRGVAVGLPRGVGEALAPGEAVAAGEAGPLGVALAPVLAPPAPGAPVVVAAPVAVVAPVVVVVPAVVLPETPTPTAAPALTP